MAKPCSLYLITPPVLAPASFRDTLAAALDAGEVAVVQLRLKDWREDDLRRAIDVLRPVAQSRDVAFLLNDRPDLAVATGCDGAHVGQDDMPVPQARALLGELSLGVTCHGSRDLAMVAGEAGADYVAFGGVLPVHHQGAARYGRARHSRMVVRADGAALRRDRRHHAGKLRTARGSRGGLPGRVEQRVGAS